MQKLTIDTGGIKFILGWLVVLAIRFIPFRPPNFEPMLAVMMPYSKRYTLISSFLFGFLGIAVFDFLTGLLGYWTLVAGVTYGLIGVIAFYFFKNREANTKNFVIFGVVGTLLYDAITGLSIGPLFFGQPFMAALVGQIPFTLMHLAGTVAFAIVLSPIMHRWVVGREELEIPFVLKKAKEIAV